MAIFLAIGSLVWIAWEVWRAPMVKEDEAGNVTWIGPTKRFRDIFKK